MMIHLLMLLKNIKLSWIWSSDLNIELCPRYPDVYICYDNHNKLLIHSNGYTKQLIIVCSLITDTLFATNEVIINIVIKSH